MLSRVYIDNYGCFVNFEISLERQQLIYGANGTGKTLFARALRAVSQLATGDVTAAAVFPVLSRTRWQDLPNQTFELDVVLDDAKYRYRLVIVHSGEPRVATVGEESVARNGQLLYSFRDGAVRHFNDQHDEIASFPFTSNRSALLTVAPRPDNQLLTRFLTWMTSLWFFQINPFGMIADAIRETAKPAINLANFAEWLRHLTQEKARAVTEYTKDLLEVIDGFYGLALIRSGQNTRYLEVSFESNGSDPIRLAFAELSEGQKCLLGLYALLHFAIARGQTVFLDEPDNFIALREIQPWLQKVEDAIAERGGQLVLVSHHPEILNRWLPEAGIQFRRDGFGPVRVSPYSQPADSALLPAELIARGWDDDPQSA